jgi:Na+-transporting NADH:ubiquinone oxidoreductase subunit E
MQEYLHIFARSIFTENMIFAYFLGMCYYLAVSKCVKTAFGMGAAVTFVLVVTLPICYTLENYVLMPGALGWLGSAFDDVNISFLSFIFFIAVVAAIVQLMEMFMERYMPALHHSFGIFLPLIAVNCAILGACLFMQQKHFSSIGVATTYGLGSGIGWLLAIVGLAAIRDKMSYSDVPKPMRGLGIAFIITALMGLGFMSFSGIKI